MWSYYDDMLILCRKSSCSSASITSGNAMHLKTSNMKQITGQALLSQAIIRPDSSCWQMPYSFFLFPAICWSCYSEWNSILPVCCSCVTLMKWFLWKPLAHKLRQHSNLDEGWCLIKRLPYEVLVGINPLNVQLILTPYHKVTILCTTQFNLRLDLIIVGMVFVQSHYPIACWWRKNLSLLASKKDRSLHVKEHLISKTPIPQQVQLMMQFGEAPRNGHAGFTMRPDTDRLKSACLFVITDIRSILASFSCAHPHVVAFEPNRVLSG